MQTNMHSPTEVSIIVILLCSFVLVSRGQECSTERQRRCRFVVLEELERRSSGLSSQELEYHCKSIRQNIDCLVWQVTQCSILEGRERSGDVIWRAWKYLQSICDTFGGWWQNRCFQREDVKQCEKHFAVDGTALSRGSCTEYDRFRDCVSDVVKRRCDPQNSQVLGTYLLDKAGEMVWRCPGNRQTALSSYGYNSAYSSALVADSPFVAGCNARATEEMRGCLDRHQYERDQSLGSRDGEERLRRSCCATWNYRRCVQNAVRTHCYDAREVEVAAAADVIGHDRDFLCREHWAYTCSGTEKMAAKMTFATLATLLLVSVSVKKWLS